MITKLTSGLKQNNIQWQKHFESQKLKLKCKPKKPVTSLVLSNIKTL